MKNRIIAPSRIYEFYDGGCFSCTDMVSYMADVGFGGIDMSFENIDRFDDAWRSVLYAAANRATEKGIILAACHLPFYMPSPLDSALMKKFFGELKKGIDAASLMGIGLAVTHPIALHSSRHEIQEWIRRNYELLAPLSEYAKSKNITLCIENMASAHESSTDHLYGCLAKEIAALADLLGSKTCWDFGHANLSGLRQSEQIDDLGKTLGLVHIHDNDGRRDLHLLPLCEGKIDWQDAALGLKRAGYNGWIDLEVKASDLSPERDVRMDFGKRTLFYGERFAKMI